MLHTQATPTSVLHVAVVAFDGFVIFIYEDLLTLTRRIRDNYSEVRFMVKFDRLFEELVGSLVEPITD